MYQGVPPQPDKGFLRKLREFDPRLFVEFDRASERFGIFKKREVGQPAFITWVLADDGGFRQPDDRELGILFMGDLWRHGGVNAHVARGEKYMEDYRTKQNKDVDDEFRHASRENKIQLSNAYRKTFNDGSKAPELRRVDVKSGGLTLDEIRTARAAGRDPWAKAA